MVITRTGPELEANHRAKAALAEQVAVTAARYAKSKISVGEQT